MVEASIEARLVSEIKKIGGLAFKFESMGNNGVPDRCVVLPGGEVWFVELKRPGEKPRKLQVYQLSKLRALGSKVRVISSYEDIEYFIKEIEAGD